MLLQVETKVSNQIEEGFIYDIFFVAAAIFLKVKIKFIFPKLLHAHYLNNSKDG